MTAWLLLVVAIGAEVAGTLALRMAVATGRRAWYVAVVAGYAVAFTSLSGSLAAGMPLGVAYGIWTAVGVALTALLSVVLFREAFNWIMALGVLLVGAGVLLVELGGH